MDSAPRIDPLAEAFARVADAYDRGRKPYPPEPVDWAWQQLGLDSSATVVDLAAGTGKLSRLLAARGARLIAIEPLSEMRRVLAERVPLAEVVDGTAEQIPLPGEVADAVFVGEAFHWFDGERALPEIHRILRPGGGLAIVFGHSDWGDLPWNDEVDARLDQVGHPQVRPQNRPWTGLWRAPFERTELFAPLERKEFPMVLTYTVEEFQLMVSTWSFVAALPQDDRDSLLDDIGRIIRAHDIDSFDLQGNVTVHLTTTRGE